MDRTAPPSHARNADAPRPLRLAQRLEAVPVERPAPTVAARPWQFLHTTPEDAARDRLELERQDRALLDLRKQVHAARHQAATARLALTEEQARVPVVALWGAGVLASVTAIGWLFERRKRMAQEEFALFDSSPALVAPGPHGFPAAVEPTGDSDYDAREATVLMEESEADQWIRRAGLALPELDPAKGAQ